MQERDTKCTPLKALGKSQKEVADWGIPPFEPDLSEKTDLDWESYLFRINNITNHNRNMKALPGMMEIWKALDLKNIGRLNSTAEALAVAYALFSNNIPCVVVVSITLDTTSVTSKSSVTDIAMGEVVGPPIELASWLLAVIVSVGFMYFDIFIIYY